MRSLLRVALLGIVVLAAVSGSHAQTPPRPRLQVILQEDEGPGPCCPGPCCPQPSPICWSKTTQALINCSSATLNDYCDSNPQWPLSQYLRDGVWTGSGCSACTASESSCGDNLDNDCDGRIDCVDPDCTYNRSCTYFQWANSCLTFTEGINYGTYETSCTDGIDNDGDGHVDCFDQDCVYGESCPELFPSDCTACQDLNGNGVIYQDWDDVRRAIGTPGYATAYRCAQIHHPFCNDLETQDFLKWMRSRHYHARVIAIHAADANDPVKRYPDGDPHRQSSFQLYYDRRNTPLSSLVPSARAFREQDPFVITMKEIVATDADIINDPHTEQEVSDFALWLQDHIYGRPVVINRVVVPLNYAAQFGAHFPCGANECFNTSPLSSYCYNQILVNPVFLHWGAKQLTNGRTISIPLVGQTCFNNERRVSSFGSMVMYAHEFGHQLGFPHPLSLFYNDLQLDVMSGLGTSGIMTRLGYIEGAALGWEPLHRYALEPLSLYPSPSPFEGEFNGYVLACP